MKESASKVDFFTPELMSNKEYKEYIKQHLQIYPTMEMYKKGEKGNKNESLIVLLNKEQ